MNHKFTRNVISCLSAFLLGVVLFWSFGKNWLDFESRPILIAGLVGVAMAVLVFAAWNIYSHTHHKEN